LEDLLMGDLLADVAPASTGVSAVLVCALIAAVVVCAVVIAIVVLVRRGRRR
jgi:hypothetical protein